MNAFLFLLVLCFSLIQLDSPTVDESARESNTQINEIPSNSDGEDSEDSDEDQAYQDFLSRTIESSDADDENFVNELNGGDVSDTDSQSSIATEDMSNDEIDMNRSAEVSSV